MNQNYKEWRDSADWAALLARDIARVMPWSPEAGAIASWSVVSVMYQDWHSPDVFLFGG
jgi:hypothetical protein